MRRIGRGTTIGGVAGGVAGGAVAWATIHPVFGVVVGVLPVVVNAAVMILDRRWDPDVLIAKAASRVAVENGDAEVLVELTRARRGQAAARSRSQAPRGSRKPAHRPQTGNTGDPAPGR